MRLEDTGPGDLPSIVGGAFRPGGGPTGAEPLWFSRDVVSGAEMAMQPPVFEIDGELVRCAVERLDVVAPSVMLINGVTEFVLAGEVVHHRGLTLRLILRTTEHSPVVRFRYELSSTTERRLSVSSQDSAITYAQTKSGVGTVTEVRLSEFSELGHAYMPNEITLDPVAARALSPLGGPIMINQCNGVCSLLAYEHGTSGGELFCGFWIDDEGVSLRSVKGAYLNGQSLTNQSSFSTPWLHSAVIVGSVDDVAVAYRTFLLRYQSENIASRSPQIFYNTWNFQERQRYWHGKSYIGELNEARVLGELAVAAQMGINTYVIDTGWYSSTGDWEIDTNRFPDRLRNIRRSAEEHGICLGLWFDPTKAALSSDAAAKHASDVKSWRGEVAAPIAVWETEESLTMCLVSDWVDTFVERLIHVNREWGVSYFKLDAVDQHGCDSAIHHHGDHTHSRQERADRFAFMMSDRMTEIALRLMAACPGSIVDFDVTENHRSFGLSFLSAGKFFLVNNGPYFSDYGLPADLNGAGTNMFFHPGPFRGWVCRAPYAFDRWIPSVLTLVHYYPDDPLEFQNDSVASLLLGHHGIWGDLLRLSPAGVERIRRALDLYRAVADDAAMASISTTGLAAGAGEVREKLSRGSGRGIVSLFPPRGQHLNHVTDSGVDREYWASEGVSVTLLESGRALVTARAAGFVLFGVAGT